MKSYCTYYWCEGHEVTVKDAAALTELVQAVEGIIEDIDPVLCSPKYKRLWDAFEYFDKEALK